MTNTPEPGANRPIPTLDVDAIIHSYEERQRRRAELRPVNKAALFEVLAGAGITAVVVVFDGYGDSGQVESMDAQSAQLIQAMATFDATAAGQSTLSAMPQDSTTIPLAVNHHNA